MSILLLYSIGPGLFWRDIPEVYSIILSVKVHSTFMYMYVEALVYFVLICITLLFSVYNSTLLNCIRNALEYNYVNLYLYINKTFYDAHSENFKDVIIQYGFQEILICLTLRENWSEIKRALLYWFSSGTLGFTRTHTISNKMR